MTTWSCKAGVLSLPMLALAACDGGQGSFLEGPGTAGKAALSKAEMAGGAVTLVPPRGYCVDAHSLRARFALMARCDTLDASLGSAGAPIGVITASFSPVLSDVLPTPEVTANALGLKNVSDTATTARAVFFRAKAPPPAEGMSALHWRATVRIGDQIMGLAMFGPGEGRATGEEGRAMLAEVIAATSAGN